MSQPRTLVSGFLRSAQAFPKRLALEVGGAAFSYADLFRRAASIAATLTRWSPPPPLPLTAVLASRSLTAYAGVLAILMRGHGYVPLNPAFPPERNRVMFERSGCRALIVDAGAEAQLEPILAGAETPLLVLLPDRPDVSAWTARWPRHQFVGASALLPAGDWQPVEVTPEAIAYVLFTSGSTGVPKGVMVAHRNVPPYIDFITQRFAITPEDRCSQTFDLTFDLSVADLFVAWESGACLCCPPASALFNPGLFINEARLTTWFSVPSTSIFMRRLGALSPGLYPRLRVVMMCGEALPVAVAQAWAAAAPGAVVENLYGPTETTISCTHYRWDPATSPAQAELGVVPIGDPLPGTRVFVADEAFHEVAVGETGELLVAGAQVTLGYLNDPQKTAAAFLVPPDKSEIYYRTADRVRRVAPGCPMPYLGRLDNQVKVLGHRVELGEIEAVLRQEAGVDTAVAIGWPKLATGVGGVEAFLPTSVSQSNEWTTRVAGRLPAYMVPRRYHYLDTFPLNPNGKFDRNALTQYLAQSL